VDVVVVAAVAAGVVLLLSGTEAVVATAPRPALGNTLGVATGAVWALTLTGMRWMGKREAGKREIGGGSESAAATAIAGNLIAFLVCLPMALPVARGTVSDAAIVLYLGVFQIGLAYILLTRSLREVQGLEASTLLLVEPVFNPLWSWLIHGERPSGSALAGGALIVLAALGGTWWQQSRPAKPVCKADLQR